MIRHIPHTVDTLPFNDPRDDWYIAADQQDINMLRRDELCEAAYQEWRTVHCGQLICYPADNLVCRDIAPIQDDELWWFESCLLFP